MAVHSRIAANDLTIEQLWAEQVGQSIQFTVEYASGRDRDMEVFDPPLRNKHPEYARKIVAYHDVGCGPGWSMHGPAVASLLVGTQCGTAPDAEVYYVAAPSWQQEYLDAHCRSNSATVRK